MRLRAYLPIIINSVLSIQDHNSEPLSLGFADVKSDVRMLVLSVARQKTSESRGAAGAGLTHGSNDDRREHPHGGGAVQGGLGGGGLRRRILHGFVDQAGPSTARPA